MFKAMTIDTQAATIRGRERCARGLVGNEFNRRDHAGLAHVGHVRVIDDWRDARRHVCREHAIAFKHGIVAEDLQRGRRRTAGQRVAGVAVRMQEGLSGGVFGVERLVDVVGGEHGRERQETAREALRQAHEVGRHARLLAGEERARATEADGDLVGDEVHVELVAQRTQAG